MKKNVRTRKLFVVTLVALAVAILAPASNLPHVYAAASADKGSPGFTTGVVGIVGGQTPRLTLWNKGDEPVSVELRFVDDQGKVLILCNEIIEPGKTEALEWPCCGGNYRVEFRAQFVASARSIGLLVPTLQIIDGTSNATSWMIGPEGFTEFNCCPGPH